jgi:glycine oxidase
MRRMGGADIVVAGAGAIGRAIALALARAGHRVAVVDPLAANASGVAAGMLAPAFECVFDPGSAGHYALLLEARDLWPALAAGIGLTLATDGALAIGTEAEARGWTAQLAALGAAARLLSPGEGHALAGLATWAAFTPEDWRLDPTTALARLGAAAEAGGAGLVRGRVVGFEAGAAWLESGERLRADRLVIATGAARALASLAPELGALTPIKGHILRASGRFESGPVIRAAGVYLCRSEREAILGATMEAGRADSDVDDEAVGRLLAAAAPLIAPLGPMRWSAAAGVRAATPDGLPLVGAAEAADVVLAVGARRNGWLLAPLIAAAVLDVVEGRAPARAAARLDPRRPAVRSPD